MGEYKKQHTVTEGYLRGFTSIETPNSLWRFDKTDGSSERCNVDKATVRFYAYSFRKSDSTWNHDIEQFLSDIESEAIPLLPKLALGDPLNDDDRYMVAMFIALTVRRPTSMLDHFNSTFVRHANDPDRHLAFFDSQASELRERFDDESIQKARVAIEHGALNYNEDAAKAIQMQGWMKSMPKQARTIARMHWQIWRADSPCTFLTSDSPAYFRRHNRIDDQAFTPLTESDTGLYFPVSKRSFLATHHSPCKDLVKATKSRVRELNALTIRMAYRHVFAMRDSEHEQSLVNSNRHFSQPLPDFSSVVEKHVGE